MMKRVKLQKTEKGLLIEHFSEKELMFESLESKFGHKKAHFLFQESSVFIWLETKNRKKLLALNIFIKT